MVVFTCGHCGESVQKPKVEKHYLTKCRNRNPNLSCMDCFKDFLGQDYEEHTKCITEEERYSGKGFTAKEKKGEKKQNAWVEMLQSVLDDQKDAPRNVLRIIEAISKHNNTPRKKPKFMNFVKNVCGPKTSPKDIDQAWDLISVKLSDLSNSNGQNKNINQKNKKNKEVSETNGDTEETENGKEDVENQNSDPQNGDTEDVNGEINQHEATNDEESNDRNGDIEKDNTESLKDNNKKLSKKQRKEEKKRRKYEAELQSAVEPSEEIEEEETQSNNKKGKKKKNKSESSNGDLEVTQSESKNKIKKRKRQDTANSVPEIQENGIEHVANEPVSKEKTQKKKLKVGENGEAEESVCLHDQNVAKIEELSMNSDKFNWHGVIMSVLEKKGNEVPFKRLQKKVLSEYSEATGRDVDDRIADKFIKKLRSAPNVRVVKNTVLLVQ